jgi:hypothetical protein
LLEWPVGLLSETLLTTLRTACRIVDATLRNGWDPGSLLVCRAVVPTFREGVNPWLADAVVVAAF